MGKASWDTTVSSPIPSSGSDKSCAHMHIWSSSTEINHHATAVKVNKSPGVRHSGLLDIAQTIDLIAAVATNDEEMLKKWKEPAMSDVKWTSNASMATIPELLRAPALRFELSV